MVSSTAFSGNDIIPSKQKDCDYQRFFDRVRGEFGEEEGQVFLI
jgi:hypothetical protein